MFISNSIKIDMQFPESEITLAVFHSQDVNMSNYILLKKHKQNVTYRFYYKIIKNNIKKQK